VTRPARPGPAGVRGHGHVRVGPAAPAEAAADVDSDSGPASHSESDSGSGSSLASSNDTVTGMTTEPETEKSIHHDSQGNSESDSDLGKLDPAPGPSRPGHGPGRPAGCRPSSSRDLACSRNRVVAGAGIEICRRMVHTHWPKVLHVCKSQAKMAIREILSRKGLTEETGRIQAYYNCQEQGWNIGKGKK
jgi:hypothetical protein